MIQTELPSLIPETSQNAVTPREYDNSVMIVDDHDNNRFYLRFLVNKFNLPSMEGKDGFEAVELWRKGKFSFIFLDFEMPGMDGLEAATRIRAEDEGVVIMICSANDDHGAIVEAARIDCDMYIIKPLMINILMELIPNMDRAAMRAAETMTVIYNTGGKRQETRRSRPSARTITPIPVMVDTPFPAVPEPQSPEVQSQSTGMVQEIITVSAFETPDVINVTVQPDAQPNSPAPEPEISGMPETTAVTVTNSGEDTAPGEDTVIKSDPASEPTHDSYA